MIEVKIQRIGDQLGVVLPAEVLARLHCIEGESVVFEETPAGDYRVTRSSTAPDLTEILTAGDQIMDQYDNALRELAK
jgi:antitoxin component of MazEF toxin-antitoxin module